MNRLINEETEKIIKYVSVENFLNSRLIKVFNNFLKNKKQKRFLDAQNMNLNSRVKFDPISKEFESRQSGSNQNANDESYREWLLKPVQQGEHDSAVDQVKAIQKENRSGSFEFLDMEKELDSIDIIEDLDDDDDHDVIDDNDDDDDDDDNDDDDDPEHNCKHKTQNEKIYGDYNDGVTRIFESILNKPTEYWLLQTGQQSL